MERKRGMAVRRISPSVTIITGMITANVTDRGASWRRASMRPPTSIMGAKIIRPRPMATTICTCCTSLVFRVISDGVPKRLISPWEKLSTLRKRAVLTSRPKAIAALAPKYVPMMVQMI
jgi:hypothetical protein